MIRVDAPRDMPVYFPAFAGTKLYCLVTEAVGVNNLPKVVAQQRHGRASNPRLLDRKSDALPLSHRATHARTWWSSRSQHAMAENGDFFA